MTKVGELSDKQMESGLTEIQGCSHCKQRRRCRHRSQRFAEFPSRHDMDSHGRAIVGTNGNADSLKFIPYSDGQTFELEKTIHVGRSGVTQNVMECRAPYSAYLKGLSEREIYNLTDAAEKQGRYAGLKIGDLMTPNNNAGNWE